MSEPRLKFLVPLVALLLLLAPVPALAQAAPAPAATTAAPAPDSAKALADLVTVLKDDTARRQLIEQLETEIGDQQPAAPDAASPTRTLGGRIGDMTQQSAEAVSASLQRFWRQITDVPTVLKGLSASDYGAMGRVLANLALLAFGTYAVFVLARFVTRRFRDRLRLRGAREGWLAATIAAIALLATNLILVAVAWAAGYVLALALIGEPGQLAFHHTLFLNAFLVTEVAQAVARALLAPRRPELRLLPVGDALAVMLTRWCRLAISIFVFGNLLLAPLLGRSLTLAFGHIVAVVADLLVLALVLNLVLRLRRPVTSRLRKATGNSNSQVLRLLARAWYVPVMLYVLVLMAMTVAQPERVVLGLLAATMKVLIAIVVGMVVAGLLTRIILSGVKLPHDVSQRMPLLERRINAFVPRLLSILRFVVVVAVIAFSLDTLGLFDVSGWLESQWGQAFTAAAFMVLLIVVVAFIAWLTLNSWIDYRIEPNPRRSAAIRARERTLLILVRNAATVTIVVFAGMFILSEIGLNIAPLLASAGVIGLAIGFGAQKLVQDIITGIFIQLEGAIDVGDSITVAGISGGVERLTIRSVGLRDLSGAYHIIPFSSVDTVTNSTRGFSQAVLDINVAFDADLTAVKAAVLDACAELKADPDYGPDMLGEMQWLGINGFGENSATVRALIKTRAGKHWGMVRAFNGIIRRIFAERGIEIPSQRRTIIIDSHGKETPALEGKPRPRRRRRPPAGGDKPA
jgi:small conductance mechanosensitive channel